MNVKLIDLGSYGAAKLKGGPYAPNVQLMTGMGIVTMSDRDSLIALTEGLAALLGLASVVAPPPTDHLIELQAIAEAVGFEEDEGDPKSTLLAAVESTCDTGRELLNESMALRRQLDYAKATIADLQDRLYVWENLEEPPARVTMVDLVAQVGPGPDDLEAAALTAGVSLPAFTAWRDEQIAKGITENLDAYEFKRLCDLGLITEAQYDRLSFRLKEFRPGEVVTLTHRDGTTPPYAELLIRNTDGTWAMFTAGPERRTSELGAVQESGLAKLSAYDQAQAVKVGCAELGVDHDAYRTWRDANCGNGKPVGLLAYTKHLAGEGGEATAPKKKRRTSEEVAADKAAKEAKKKEEKEAGKPGGGIAPDPAFVPQLKVEEVTNPETQEVERAGRPLHLGEVARLERLLTDAGMEPGPARSSWLWDRFQLVNDLTFVKLDQYLAMVPQLEEQGARLRVTGGLYQPGDGVKLFKVPRMPVAMAIEVAKNFGLTPFRTEPIANFIKGILFANGVRQGEDTEQPDSLDSEQWALRISNELKPQATPAADEDDDFSDLELGGVA